MQLIMVRHGATSWSILGRHTGRTDVPLSEEGEAQVLAVRATIHHLTRDLDGPLRVISSPLQRALRTAEISCDDLAQVTTDPRLMEMDYGEYEGLTATQIRGIRPNWDFWIDGFPGGETVIDVGVRVDAFLGTIEDDATTILFAHGHLLKVLAARVLGLGPTEGRIFEIDPASISIIGDQRGHRSITAWNLEPSQAPSVLG